MERIQFIPHRGFWHYYQISNESGKHDILLSFFNIIWYHICNRKNWTKLKSITGIIADFEYIKPTILIYSHFQT